MSKVLNIGQMDRLVSIEQNASGSTDVGGQRIENWIEYGKWWCAISQDTSGERNINMQRTGNRMYTLRGRYVGWLRQDMRINDNGTTYYITGVMTQGRNEMTIVSAEWRDSLMVNAVIGED
jgi:SPP1 family predicted phage head-tail adaptor